MPNKDGTGPEGKGPKTGRQKGNCKGAKPNKNVLQLGFGRRPRRVKRSEIEGNLERPRRRFQK